MNPSVETLLAEVARLQGECERANCERDEWKRLAHLDPLTGLPNRRAWDERLQAGRRQPSSCFAVALFDIDQFKAINERLGFARGDEVLKQVAARLAATIREREIVARLGGDECGIVLEAVDRTAALNRLEQIRAASCRDAADDSLVAAMTASIGCVVIEPDRPLPSPAELYFAASDALRQAKLAGRNCLAMSSPS